MSPAQPPLPGQPHNGRFELPELSEECKVEAVKQSLAQMSAGKGTRCGSQGPTSRIIVVSASTSDILLLNSPSTSLASCCRAATAFSRARTPSAVLLASSFSRVSSYRRERHFARGQSMAEHSGCTQAWSWWELGPSRDPGTQIITGSPASFMCSHQLVQRVVCMIRAQPIWHTLVSPWGITTRSLGVRPTSTKPGISSACQQLRP